MEQLKIIVIFTAVSITNPPDGSQAGLVSVEIFAYIGFVVILLTDSNKHRTVALFGFLGNLIPVRLLSIIAL